MLVIVLKSQCSYFTFCMQNNENDSSSIYVFYKPDSKKVGTLYKL